MNFSISSITLTNFRAVKETVKVDFTNYSPGFYFISGENKKENKLGSNGAGKSSIFSDSISWVFSGRISRANRPGSDIENWDSEGSTKIKCEFILNNVTYVIERIRKPNGIFLNGEKVEQDDVDKLLPLSDSAFRRTILVDQFGQLFLSLRPEDKSRIFSETLDLDKWLIGSENAGLKVRQTEKDISTIETKITGLSASIAEVRDQFEAARKQEELFDERLSNSIKDLKLKLSDLNTKVKKSETILNEARAEFAKFSDLNDIKVEINSLKTDERKVTRSIADKKALIQNNEREKTRLEESLDAYEKESLCPECGQPISQASAREKANELKEKLKALLSNKAKLNAEVIQLINTEDSYVKNIESLDLHLEKYNNAQLEVSKAANENLVLLREFHSLEKQISDLKDQENPFTKQCDNLEERHKKYKSEVRTLKQKLEDYLVDLEIYKFWQKGFKEIRLNQIDDTLLELELAANRQAVLLGLDGWEIKFATERETTSGSISHKFSIFIYPPDKKEPISFESYSGGEAQRWQLAVTLALSEILLARAGIETDIEILDEPTTHLSQEGIDDLLYSLKDRASELKRRIFLIDHRSLDRGSFDGIINVIKDESGVRVE